MSTLEELEPLVSRLDSVSRAAYDNITRITKMEGRETYNAVSAMTDSIKAQFADSQGQIISYLEFIKTQYSDELARHAVHAHIETRGEIRNRFWFVMAARTRESEHTTRYSDPREIVFNT